MTNQEQKNYLDLIKKHMKKHSITTIGVSLFDTWIGERKFLPKGLELLLVPIKGMHSDYYCLTKIMLLQDELHFFVENEQNRYRWPRKRETYRLSWDELVTMVESAKWSRRADSFGGKGNHSWTAKKLRNLESWVRCYDAMEEAEWRNRPQLTDVNVDIYVDKFRNQRSIPQKIKDGIENIANSIFGY